MNIIRSSKTLSVSVCFVVYIVAVISGRITLNYFQKNFELLIATLIGDIVATIVVFFFSIIFRNSSLYDPYWSVAPPLIVWYWIDKIPADASLTVCLILGVIIIWSVRLTVNWLRGWRGLNHEDWRYIQLRNENPKLYPFINLSGIHIFPTVMVFICLVPCYFSLTEVKYEINFISISGAVICITATLISFIADEQLRRFRNNEQQDKSIQSGLWKYSRHPNYLGEILFWWGVWLIAIGIDTKLYWTAFGCIALTLMFIFISIPMMEKRNLVKRKEYEQVVKKVPMLVKWFW